MALKADYDAAVTALGELETDLSEFAEASKDHAAPGAHYDAATASAAADAVGRALAALRESDDRHSLRLANVTED